MLPSGRKGWLCLGKNEATVLPVGDDATTLLVRTVRRVDWVAADGGPRRGMDIESCFEVGATETGKSPDRFHP